MSIEFSYCSSRSSRCLMLSLSSCSSWMSSLSLPTYCFNLLTSAVSWPRVCYRFPNFSSILLLMYAVCIYALHDLCKFPVYILHDSHEVFVRTGILLNIHAFCQQDDKQTVQYWQCNTGQPLCELLSCCAPPCVLSASVWSFPFSARNLHQHRAKKADSCTVVVSGDWHTGMNVVNFVGRG